MHLNPHSPGCLWHRWTELLGAANIRWCEQVSCGLIAEPANTWSNLAFVVVGILLLKRSPAAAQLGRAVILMGAFSFVYHMSLNFVSQWLDFVGMFVTFSCIFAYRLSLQKYRHLLWAAPSALIVPMYFLQLPYQYFIIFFALIALLLEVRKHTEGVAQKYLFGCAIAFGLAFASSMIEYYGAVCDPESWIQFHSLWHLLSAVGFLLLGLRWDRESSIDES